MRQGCLLNHATDVGPRLLLALILSHWPITPGWNGPHSLREAWSQAEAEALRSLAHSQACLSGTPEKLTL